jgi:hypothetical protein
MSIPESFIVRDATGIRKMSLRLNPDIRFGV